MKSKQYVITGITEQNIIDWGNSLRDDIKIFSILHKGKRQIKIYIRLTQSEYLKIKTQLFMFNLKHKTNINVKSC